MRLTDFSQLFVLIQQQEAAGFFSLTDSTRLQQFFVFLPASSSQYFFCFVAHEAEVAGS